MEEGDEIIRVVNNNLLESSEIQQLKQDILRHETLAFVREQELNNTIQVLLDNTRQLQEGIMSSNVKEFSKPNHAFIMKNLRTFSGKDPDTFDSWILQTKFILEDSNLTEKEKVRIVLMKLDGNARELVDNLKVTNTETIFKVLKNTYGKDQLTVLATTKQNTGESAKISVANKISLEGALYGKIF